MAVGITFCNINKTSVFLCLKPSWPLVTMGTKHDAQGVPGPADLATCRGLRSQQALLSTPPGGAPAAPLTPISGWLAPFGSFISPGSRTPGTVPSSQALARHPAVFPHSTYYWKRSGLFMICLIPRKQGFCVVLGE